MTSFISTFFFFNDTATTEIYTLSLHDALPIYPLLGVQATGNSNAIRGAWQPLRRAGDRSEEHTSELQSQSNLVCRLLLEKKKKRARPPHTHRTNTTDAWHTTIHAYTRRTPRHP